PTGAPPAGAPPTGAPPAGAPPAGPNLDQRRAEMEKQEAEVKALLTEPQRKRFDELVLQLEGPSALGRPEVAKQVGLSEDQQAKIQAAQQSQMQAMRDLMQESRDGGGDREAMMVEMAKMREATNKAILDLLTEPQKRKWAEMQGKPFTFESTGR
ncbi:MAG: hypothetical protein H0W86_04640, partial [Armatimonadetes bacterium]|nr:hypothetical protein [Armatimonadota bacterium]